MEERGPKDRERKPKARHPIERLRRVNWWGVFGLLCGIGSAYLSLRIFLEAITLLGFGP